MSSVVRLTLEDIPVPLAELPDPESDAGNPSETLRQQENKWTGTEMRLSPILFDNPDSNMDQSVNIFPFSKLILSLNATN